MVVPEAVVVLTAVVMLEAAEEVAVLGAECATAAAGVAVDDAGDVWGAAACSAAALAHAFGDTTDILAPFITVCAPALCGGEAQGPKPELPRLLLQLLVVTLLLRVSCISPPVLLVAVTASPGCVTACAAAGPPTALLTAPALLPLPLLPACSAVLLPASSPYAAA